VPKKLLRTALRAKINLFQDYIDKTNDLEMLCKSNRESSSDWNKLLADLVQAKKSVLEASVYALQVLLNIKYSN
jgi:hypothetical protein